MVYHKLIMKNINIYSRPILLILISIIIYCSLFFFLYLFLILNENIFSFVNKINIFIQPRPNFLLIEDVLNIILPTVFILDSIFCGLIVFILNKVFVKNIPEIFKQIKYYMIRISILVIFVFFINYIKSFTDNRKIINKYHEVR